MLTAALVAACGTAGSSSSGGAQNLLKQTFSGPHTVKSGVLSFGLTIDPSGSSTLKTPISLALSGPFQSRGSGQVPASNLNIAIDALGHHGQLGIVSTGASGYITLDGAAYQLPVSSYQKLASSFTGAAGVGGVSALSKLGINPLHWLDKPSIVGSDTVGGAPTTHIRAHVNVAALLSDLNTFLHKASLSGATGAGTIPGSISAATRQKLAAEVKSPEIDIWTGANDQTLRKLTVSLNLRVTGQISSLLGGMSSAGIEITLQYSHINQPQTISAPGNVQPYSGFATKLQSILAGVQNTLGSSGSTSSSSGAPTSSGSSSGSAASQSSYSTCIQQAAGDVSTMQTCAALLNSGG